MVKINRLIKKIKKLLFDNQNSKIPNNYKICPDCNGFGYEDLFFQCEKCDGKGIVRKTYKEYVDTLPLRQD